MSAPSPETVATRFPALVRELDARETGALAAAFEVHDADAGEALVAEGTHSDELFLVDDGVLDISVGSRRVAGVEPGEMFGEVSLFDAGLATATVATEQGCRVLRLPRSRFDELRASESNAAASLQREVLRSLVARLRAAAASLENPR